MWPLDLLVISHRRSDESNEGITFTFIRQDHDQETEIPPQLPSLQTLSPQKPEKRKLKKKISRRILAIDEPSSSSGGGCASSESDQKETLAEEKTSMENVDVCVKENRHKKPPTITIKTRGQERFDSGTEDDDHRANSGPGNSVVPKPHSKTFWSKNSEGRVRNQHDNNTYNITYLILSSAGETTPTDAKPCYS
ncbi:hypothetical protein BGZ52_005707 [Haplosporangium bisporale]|nr:hypothetical protein BGZ52_005707 [Haplosporangium bisporale]